MSDSVLSVWVSTMHQCAAVHLALTSLTGLHHTVVVCSLVSFGRRLTVQEHIDLGFSRTSRDCNNMQKLLDWFDGHDPFQIPHNMVCNEKVTCDTAEELGAIINEHLDGVKIYGIE